MPEGLVRLLRSDDQTRSLGDALLDQRNLAGIGNIWKAEGCWEAGVDPWRPMQASAERGPRSIERPAGDANRTTYWCPGCQK
jgi:endonuclease VIII